MHLKKTKKEKKEKKQKKRLFLSQPLSPPKRGGEGGERRKEEERRKKRQSFPLSLPLSDDASLYYTYKKPSSLGRAGIQTVVHFTIRKLKNKTNTSNATY